MSETIEHDTVPTEEAEEHTAKGEMAPVQGGNPLDVPTEQFSQALQRRGENRKALIEWVRSHLVEGVDFGKIKVKGKWSKPTLWKPGAEKICGMLGVTATFPRMQDYEQAALEGREIKSIIMRCHLVNQDGQIVADGLGARSLEQDNGDLNKALKMACKSSHIDAALRMAGLSEVFTQDVEDMIREGKMEGEAQQPPSDDEKKPSSSGQQHPVERTEPLTDTEVAHIRQLMADTETDEQTFLGAIAPRISQSKGVEIDIPQVEDIPPSHYEWACKQLHTKAKRMHQADEATLADKGEQTSDPTTEGE